MVSSHIVTSPLLERFLAPARPALEAALATVAGHTDPRAAWSALGERGLLPASWLDEPRRCFPWFHGSTELDRSESLRWVPWVPRSPCPDDVTACALLAADVDGIERAEAAGRRFVSAMRAWGIPAADVVMWTPTSLDGYGYQLSDTKPDRWEPDSLMLFAVGEVVWEEVERVVERLEGEAALASPAMDPHRRTVAARNLAVWVFTAERWSRAVQARVQPYAELPDPFPDAFEVFEAGYTLMPSGDGVLVLGYPAE